MIPKGDIVMGFKRCKLADRIAAKKLNPSERINPNTWRTYMNLLYDCLVLARADLQA